MRPGLQQETLKLIVIVVAALFWTAGALGEGPRDRGGLGANVATPDEAALNALFERIRHPDQFGQAEIIPIGVNPTAIAATEGGSPDIAPATGGGPAAGSSGPTPGGPAPGSETAGDPAGRYRWFGDRWWYWMPDNHWVWWDQRQGWIDDGSPPAAAVPAPPLAAPYPYYPGCDGYRPTQVVVVPGAVSVSAGPVLVGVGGGHVGVSVFGIGFGF